MSADAMKHFRNLLQDDLETSNRPQEPESFLHTLLKISADAKQQELRHCISPLHWRTPRWFMARTPTQRPHEDSDPRLKEAVDGLLAKITHHKSVSSDASRLSAQLLSLFSFLTNHSEQITEATSPAMQAFDSVVEILRLYPQATRLARDAHIHPFVLAITALPAPSVSATTLVPPTVTDLNGAGLSPNAVLPDKIPSSVSAKSSKASKKRKNAHNPSNGEIRKMARGPPKKKVVDATCIPSSTGH